MACVILVAFSARLGAVLALGSISPTAGSYEHGFIARELASGNGFRYPFYGPPEPTSHQAPLVSWSLAGAYLVFGTGTPAAHLAWQIVAAGLGTAACALVTAIGCRLAGPRLGFLAGLLASIYPPLVYAALRIQSINFTVPALLCLVWLAARHRDERRLGLAAALGACGGLGMLAEPILGAPLAVLITWMAIIGRSGSRWLPCLRPAGIAGATALVILLPWTARNLAVHGRLVLVKSSFPYVLWQGNNPAATGTDKLLPPHSGEERTSQLAPAAEEDRLNRLRREARSVDETLSPDFVALLRSQPSEILNVLSVRRLCDYSGESTCPIELHLTDPRGKQRGMMAIE
jgi:4-amino-4-deoxy-L-arabinose transferase-like glycosyltransferase